MTTYRIDDEIVQSSDPALTSLVASIYGTKTRPFCLCRQTGVEMYLAKVSGTIVIKRMPNTGGDHAATCDSYEPPPELSGLGEVAGTAIQEDTATGLTTLKFDFSLSKSPGRPAPIPSGNEKDTVKTDGIKLTLRSTLNFLWQTAGFNQWSPVMAGKRSWFVIRKYLLQAAADKIAKGANLAEILYIPESYSVEKGKDIAQRRLNHMMKVFAPGKGPKRLMLVIGEVKEIAPSRYGYKIVLKHAPDFHFMMPEDMHKRLSKRFEAELALWDAMENTHLMMIGTFSIGTTGVASLEETALMGVTENWIPFENTFDKMLLDTMTAENRRFTKGLRYNLPSTRPLACVVASDTQPEPTGMYILPLGATDEYTAAMNVLIDESKLDHWLWNAGQAEMPPLPSVRQ